MPPEVLTAYEVTEMHFGKDYILPTQFDPRLIERIAPAVRAAAEASRSEAAQQKPDARG